MVKLFLMFFNDIWGYVFLLVFVKEILNVLSRLSVGESLLKYVIGEEYWWVFVLFNMLLEKCFGCFLC